MSFSPEVGIGRLKKLLQTKYDQIPEEFYVLEMRLAKNRRDATLFGDNDPSISSELHRILLELHRFALEHTNAPFNDFCEDSPARVFPVVNGRTPAKSEVSLVPGSPSSSLPDLGTKRRWAVLVGVGSYADQAFDPLPVCVGDVTKVADQLHRNESGYTLASIHLRVDNGIPPTREAILASLQNVVEAAEADDLLLFYYSGHGELEQEECYLITKDSLRGKLKETALPVAEIEKMMQSSRAKAKVMILDACHAGEQLQSKSAGGLPPKFLDRVFSQAEGIAILASCEKHQKSYIWESKECSVYTHFLLEALSGKADHDGKSFVSVDDIDAHVTNGVKSWAERHNYNQTPTRHFRAHGRIIVTFYKKSLESSVESQIPAEAALAGRQKQASLVPVLSPPWSQSDTIVIRGETYILHKATIEEKPTRDNSAVLRSAQAQHVVRGNMVYVRQVALSRLTPQGNALREILKSEHRLALKLVQHRDFPRVLEEEGIADETRDGAITLVYEGWVGPTLDKVFHRPGKVLGKTEAVSLVWIVIRLCEVLNILHRERYSHRALTGEDIILAGGDTRRPVLRNFGLAGQKACSGDKEQVPIQAPEQRYTVPEWPLPGVHTDIYQLGVILSTFIMGQPFSSTKPGTDASILPTGIDEVITRAVATNPRERWPTIMMFAGGLRQVLRAKNN